MADKKTFDCDTGIQCTGKVTLFNPEELLETFNDIMWNSTIGEIACYVLRCVAEGEEFVEGVGEIGKDFIVDELRVDPLEDDFTEC